MKRAELPAALLNCCCCVISPPSVRHFPPFPHCFPLLPPHRLLRSPRCIPPPFSLSSSCLSLSACLPALRRLACPCRPAILLLVILSVLVVFSSCPLSSCRPAPHRLACPCCLSILFRIVLSSFHLVLCRLSCPHLILPVLVVFPVLLIVFPVLLVVFPVLLVVFPVLLLSSSSLLFFVQPPPLLLRQTLLLLLSLLLPVDSPCRLSPSTPLLPVDSAPGFDSPPPSTRCHWVRQVRLPVMCCCSSCYHPRCRCIFRLSSGRHSDDVGCGW